MIVVQGRPLKVKEGQVMLLVKDLWENKGFLDYSEDKRCYSIKETWYQYYPIISAIPDVWCFFLKMPALIDNNKDKYETIISLKSALRTVYQDIMSSDQAILRVRVIWHKLLACDWTVEDCAKLFKNIYQVTTITKLCSFQYRLLHNKVFCNNILVHWGKVNSNLCDFCSIKKQDITHLLFHCAKIRPIWMKFRALIRKADGKM